MKRLLFHIAVIALLPATLLAASGDVQMLKIARSQVRLIAGELMQKVSLAVQQGGAENALASCSMQSMDIIRRLTSESGWTIRRTSLRVRNPANAPDDWERDVLLLFEQRRAEGENMQDFEFAKVVNVDGKRVFRYMKPIVTQPGCTLCHGQDLSPGVQQKISEIYPHDQAVGFSPGELRGAFSMLRVLPGDPP